MAEGGWVKLHRRLMEKAIWTSSSAEQKIILITLLMMANHEGKEWEWQGKQFKANPGEFVTSAKSIMAKAGDGISRQNVRTALEKFKKYEFLTYQSTKTGLLINIVNWVDYQAKNVEPNQPINHEVTNRSPSPNQQVTTNKNVKNDKNDKKYIYISEFTQNKLLIETIIDFMKMRDKIKKPMTDKALQIMINKLKGLSEDEEIQIKILENSIEHCWQGIFQLKEDSNGSTRQNTGSSEKKFNVKIPEWQESNRAVTGDEPI
jgi:hypothetical protein